MVAAGAFGEVIAVVVAFVGQDKGQESEEGGGHAADEHGRVLGQRPVGEIGLEQGQVLAAEGEEERLGCRGRVEGSAGREGPQEGVGYQVEVRPNLFVSCLASRLLSPIPMFEKDNSLLEVQGLRGEIVVMLQMRRAGRFQRRDLKIEVAADQHVHLVAQGPSRGLVVVNHAVVETGDVVCDSQRAGNERGLGGVGSKGRA